MKKNLLIATLVFVYAPLLKAQNPVPNSSFENWTSGNPDDWYAFNFGPGASPVMQTTPGYTSASAMLGEVIAVGPTTFFPIVSSTDASGTGFPVSQQYANLTFYYKTNVTGTFPFQAGVDIEDVSGNIIGSGIMLFSGITPSFTLATIPIIYTSGTPAEAIIAFTLNDTVVGSSFVVDDVELSNPVGIDEKHSASFGIEKVQPNPARDFTSVYYSLPVTGDITFEVLDVTGRSCKTLLLKNETAGRHKMDLDSSDLPAGIYFLKMIGAAGRRVASLQVIE